MISGQKLDAALQAMERILNVKEDYEQRIEAAASPEKSRLTKEGHQAMVEVVIDQGFTVAEYNSIIDSAAGDPEMRDRLVELARLKREL